MWYNKQTLSQGEKNVPDNSSNVSEKCNISFLHWRHLFLELCLQLCDCEKASVLRTRFTSLASVCTQLDSGCLVVEMFQL